MHRRNLPSEASESAAAELQELEQWQDSSEVQRGEDDIPMGTLQKCQSLNPKQDKLRQMLEMQLPWHFHVKEEQVIQ